MGLVTGETYLCTRLQEQDMVCFTNVNPNCNDCATLSYFVINEMETDLSYAFIPNVVEPYNGKKYYCVDEQAKIFKGPVNVIGEDYSTTKMFMKELSSYGFNVSDFEALYLKRIINNPHPSVSFLVDYLQGYFDSRCPVGDYIGTDILQILFGSRAATIMIHLCSVEELKISWKIKVESNTVCIYDQNDYSLDEWINVCIPGNGTKHIKGKEFLSLHSLSGK